MRRSAPLATRSLLPLLLLSLSPLGCGAGGRDAHDIAHDFEGTVSPETVDRLARDVDLSQAPVTISVGRDSSEHFGASDHPALESYLRDVAAELSGSRVRVTQQVVDDTGTNSQRLTLTLSVEQEGETRFVPVTLDLVRNGRRMIVTSARVMLASR